MISMRSASSAPDLADSHAARRKRDANRPFFACAGRGKRQIDFPARTRNRPPATEGVDSLNIIVPMTATPHQLYRGDAAPLVDIQSGQALVPESARVDRPRRRGLIGKDGYISNRQNPTGSNCLADGVGLLAVGWRAFGRILCGI